MRSMAALANAGSGWDFRVGTDADGDAGGDFGWGKAVSEGTACEKAREAFNDQDGPLGLPRSMFGESALESYTRSLPRG
jgi:hypothetical protein